MTSLRCVLICVLAFPAFADLISSKSFRLPSVIPLVSDLRARDGKSSKSFRSFLFHVALVGKITTSLRPRAESSDNGLAALSFQRFSVRTADEGCARTHQRPN